MLSLGSGFLHPPGSRSLVGSIVQSRHVAVTTWGLCSLSKLINLLITVV